jgi:hypothetical protein
MRDPTNQCSYTGRMILAVNLGVPTHCTFTLLETLLESTNIDSMGQFLNIYKVDLVSRIWSTKDPTCDSCRNA